MTLPRPTRRQLIRGAGAALIAAPFYRLLAGGRARADAITGGARRFIVFNFPDGVPARSADGEPSLWHPTGSETSFSLPDVLSPLSARKSDCVFFSGLSMGSADAGSHPGGAKKLLTAVDGGNGISIDQHLAKTVGGDRPFRHIYLGAMANQNGASGDKHISYLGPGQTVTPEDDPAAAFQRLFDAEPPPQDGSTTSVLDLAKTELGELRARLGSIDQAKLDLHLESVRELEQRLGGGSGEPGPSCENPSLGPVGPLYEPERLPDNLRAQIDVMVQAMACELSRVGVIQCSHHTSDLLMSRFPGTPMYDPGFDMRSHQASHYGPSHDFGHREFADYVAQRRWFVEQFAYLLDQLAARPEGDGTMLDYSLVLLCTEVSDGNTHSHDDMPFILAGRGGGAVEPGRLLQLGYHRHADLLLAIAHAMGNPIASFGEASTGPLPGLLA